jgi:3-hydroxyisobutyrate dehydrogenase
MHASPTLGYIGLGKMGGPMALRLARAGYRLHVFGRNTGRLAPVLAEGAIACADPAEVAANSDIVVTCVTDTAAVEEIVFGKRGIAAGARKDSLLVDMSTISPAETIRMASRLKESAGMRWIDAPVSGGAKGAEAGSLVVMVGGSDEDLHTVRPVLAHLGHRITLMGAIGAGQTTKLINQVMVAGTMGLLAEAIGLAARAGIDAAKIPGAVAGGRADSTMLQHFWERTLACDFTPSGSIASISKDLDLIHSFAKNLNVTLPLMRLVSETNRHLLDQGFGEEDINSIYRLYWPDPSD